MKIAVKYFRLTKEVNLFIQGVEFKMKSLFLELKKQATIQKRTTAKERIQLLTQLDNLIMSHLDQITHALYADLHKSKSESLLTEVYPIRQEIKFAIKNLSNWMQDQPVSSPLALKMSQSYVHTEAKGVCLIISPWNYPFQLAIAPLIAAIAAGNTCIIKPSEIAIHTSAIIKKLIKSGFKENVCVVIEGDQKITTQLLDLHFDHIFFTGSTSVGKIIMQAASHHLSGVTLELGGKSPAVVTKNANIQLSAEKIVWGKIVNRGQTCVAPDFVIVHESMKEQLIQELLKNIHVMDKDEGATRIINQKHYLRLSHLVESAKKSFKQLSGVIVDESKLIIDLHLFDCGPLTRSNEPIMNEEIFGPILPILTYASDEQLFNYFNETPRPLAFYLFSNLKSEQEIFVQSVSCGGLSINDCLIHVAHHSLPFGGIGESGIGNYHGYSGFLTFSHQKSIFKQGMSGKLLKLFYPPYTKKIEKLILYMTKLNM